MRHTMLDNKTFLTTASLLVTLVLVTLKALASVWSGSVSLLAELLNNSVDVLSALIAVLIVRWSDRPADADHPYGHGKAESLGALCTAGLLIATYLAVGWQALQRLVTPQPLHHLDWAALVVAAGVGVNLLRQWAFARAARRQVSQQLAAEALNVRMDIAASLVTLAALGLAVSVPAAALLADPLGALMVVVGALILAGRLARTAIDTLLDRTSPERTAHIRQAVLQLDGVADVPVLRVREVGARCFVDLVAAVPRTLALEAADDLAHRIEAQVRGVVGAAEVLVHTEPVVAQRESLAARVQAVAARHGDAVHNVAVYRSGDALYAQLDLELPPRLSLGQAHARASTLEERIEQELGITHAWIHIEPAGDLLAPCQLAEHPAVLEAITGAVSSIPLVRRVDNIRLDHSDDGLLLALDCQFDPQISVAAAHQVAEQLEHTLRSRVQRLARIAIHTEPFGAVDR